MILYVLILVVVGGKGNSRAVFNNSCTCHMDAEYTVNTLVYSQLLAGNGKVTVSAIINEDRELTRT
jgi:hypothetical protein